MTVEWAFHVFYNVFVARFEKYGGIVMEQLNLTAIKDTDKVYQILDDLISMNREFQIMITVPSGSKSSEKKSRGQESKKKNSPLTLKRT